MLLTAINSGDFVKLQGVDFGSAGAKKVIATVKSNGQEGVIRVTTKTVNGDVAGYIPVKGDGNETTVIEAELDQSITGLQDVYFTFYGDGYEVADWRFE